MKSKMQLLIVLAVALVVPHLLHAQATSRVIPFNNVATNYPPSTTQSVVVQLWDAANAGTLLFSESQPNLSVDANSNISFVFGSQTSNGLDPNNFPSGSSRFLDVVDATTQLSVLPNGRLPLNATPFALSPGPQGPAGPAGPAGPQGPPGVVQAVTAGDTSITVGGTTANPTVAVAANGITNANVANSALSPAKITGTAATLGANLFTATQTVRGNGLNTLIGDPGCSTGFAGIAFSGSFTNCTNYALVGDNLGHTYINSSSTGGAIHFRHNNAFFPADQMTITPGGDLLVGSVPNPLAAGENLYVGNTGGDPKVTFRLDGFQNSVYLAGHSATGATQGAGIVFRTALAGGGEFDRMTIMPGGNVGIGTNGPIPKLHVQNGASSFSATGLDGIFGECSAVNCRGVVGGSTNGNGVEGNSTSGTGVFGTSSGTGVFGTSFTGTGVEGNSPSGTGVVGASTSGLAGQFFGNVLITGNLTKGSGSFRIDHPLDPANKYLSHSFVESPDMMNIYDGIVALNSRGEAWVHLPEWFEALNRDFRYQLTAIGAPQPKLYVAREISGNRFKIAGGKPGGKVSWLVTGIRQDSYAKAHPIAVEQDKPAEERGSYLHPELFGQPAEKAIGALRRPPAPKGARGENAAQH